jgi:hypothetical protein
MGFNKRWVVLDRCIDALKKGNLKQYYGKSDMLHFEDELSSLIHDLYCQGKSDEEILIIINQNLNTEETTNEVH